MEGFFILESSVDASPEKILSLYKNRDKAEKFVRSLKEGNELRPLRHFSKWAVIGAVFICFLATALINLTLTIVYPRNRFRFSVVSNIRPPISRIFGDFMHRYGDKNLGLRW